MVIKSQHIPDIELQKLIKGCVARDRSCQKQVYDLFGPGMMILCLRFSRNREEAEEVLQDGFLQMYKYISQYKYKGTFEGWLRKIMINCALQRYRSKVHHFNSISLSEEHDLLTTHGDFIERISEKELIRLIQTLPTGYRLVFNLYVFEGLKHSEIASFLNIKEGTSKSNLSDARAILKKSLTRDLRMAK
ncbi:MAG: RNA polymerase sigma factor [Puia sp.]